MIGFSDFVGSFAILHVNDADLVIEDEFHYFCIQLYHHH